MRAESRANAPPGTGAGALLLGFQMGDARVEIAEILDGAFLGLHHLGATGPLRGLQHLLNGDGLPFAKVTQTGDLSRGHSDAPLRRGRARNDERRSGAQ